MSVIAQTVEAGDPAITLISGQSRLGPERFPDGIHPDDTGHERLGTEAGPVLVAALEEEKR